MISAVRSVVPLLKTSIGMSADGRSWSGRLRHGSRRGCPLAKPAGDDIEGFRARMGVDRSLGSRRAGSVIDAQQVSGAVIGGTGPISATLLPPGVAPPLAPSVNSQTLPATSATSHGDPSYDTVSGFQRKGRAADFAWSSVGKFSIRQYSGPGGSCLIFISATGLTTYGACGGGRRLRRSKDRHRLPERCRTIRARSGCNDETEFS